MWDERGGFYFENKVAQDADANVRKYHNTVQEGVGGGGGERALDTMPFKQEWTQQVVKRV